MEHMCICMCIYIYAHICSMPVCVYETIPVRGEMQRSGWQSGKKRVHSENIAKDKLHMNHWNH